MLFPNLEGELKKRKITRIKIANDMSLNVSTVSRKLTEKGRLKYDEAITIKKLYFPDLQMEYLFSDKLL